MRFTSAFCLVAAAAAAPAFADSTVATNDMADSVAIVVPDIDFTSETLDNGLRVVYAPMDNAPVVHVRVLYHVGSKDEQPDRQGFAHLFEHMMFRGSEHVASEEHMKRINGVGGSSNAFTSFDQTTYINTVPANALEMALWLEADRMASFKVDEEKFVTERSVVNEEFLQRVANPPYGRQFIDFFDLAFDESHYQWTPIGDMEQLSRSTTDELQAFFDTFYVPNNAVLAIAGDFEVDEARAMVRDYFGWMPSGGEIPRPSPMEPVQSQKKEKSVYVERAPLPALTLAFKTGGWGDDDVVALEVLGNILGQGRSSRMYERMVAGSPDSPPMAQQASAGLYRMEDAGLMFASLFVLPGVDPKAAEVAAMDVIADVAENGVTEAELAKAKTQLKLGLLRGRQTADSVATSVAEAWAFGDDPDYANRRDDQIDAVTVEDVARVAREYLVTDKLSALTYLPGRDPSGAPEATDESNDTVATEPDGAPPSDNETTTAEMDFPADYPTAAPVPADIIAANFDTGVEFDVDGTQVILIRDTRLPLVGMTLIMPGYGSDAVPADKVGLASLAADLLTRGSAGRSAAEQNELLDAAGISLSASDGGDHTRVTGSFPKGSMADAVMFANELLTQPNLDEREFANLRARAAAGLQQSLSDPSGVASRELDTLLFGDTPAGRNPDPRIVASLTLEDAVEHVKRAYGREGQTLILAGDLDEAEATEFASKLLDGVKLSSSKTIDPIAYELSAYRPQILLVDNPGGGQSAVRLGNRAFKIDSDEKYAASVATQVLAGGIESRLNQAMRAEKGLTYGAGGRFNPGRHVGEFFVGFATRPETTGEAITTAFGVLTRMASESVSEEELVDAQRRVAGSLVLSQQTVGQLANLRGNILLNGYPLSYFNDYGQKIAGVDVQDVQNVIASYATPDLLSIVVVAPADAVKTQLDQIGDVTVVPMPLARQPEAMTP